MVGMRWLVLALLGACSFRPGELTGGGGGDDAGPSDDARLDDAGEIEIDGSPPANGHVRRIEIQDFVAGGPHVDFPVLVILDDSWLRDEANSGDVARADGFDIYFAADIGGAQRLAFEVERYAPVDGELTAWVKVPSLSAATELFIHYGDAAITTSQAMPAQVWSGGYVFVAHLAAVSDSTGNTSTPSIAGSTSGTPTGQIGTGLLFDGSDDYVDAKSIAAIDDIFGGGGTAEGWARPTSYGENGFGRLFDKGHEDGWSLCVNDGNATNSLGFVHGGSSSIGEWNGPSNSVSLNAWHHIAVTYDSGSAANNPVLYVDGAALTPVELVSPQGTMDSDASRDLFIGNRQDNTRTFTGILDELRLSSTPRSTDWILTQYRNHTSPSTFYSVSSEL